MVKNKTAKEHVYILVKTTNKNKIFPIYASYCQYFGAQWEVTSKEESYLYLELN